MTDEPKQDWNRPNDCHCLTLQQRSQCYEYCDPVEIKRYIVVRETDDVSIYCRTWIGAQLCAFRLGLTGFSRVSVITSKVIQP